MIKETLSQQPSSLYTNLFLLFLTKSLSECEFVENRAMKAGRLNTPIDMNEEKIANG